MKNIVAAIYMQIGVNIIGLPEYYLIRPGYIIPKKELPKPKSKYHS